jgi:hypothetical protein
MLMMIITTTTTTTMIMSMGWNYVSELRPPTGLLFILQMIYEHGEPWWNDDADRGKIQTRPPELSGNPTNRHLVASRRSRRNEWVFGVAKYFCSYLQVIFTCRKILRQGPLVLLPLRTKVCYGLLSPLKIHRLGRVWTYEPWVQWQAH